MSTIIEKVVPKVGDILISSWGYDQTNIDYYKVVRTTDKSVWIQQVRSKALEQVGWAHYVVAPTDDTTYEVRDWNTGELVTKSHSITRHKIQEPFSFDKDGGYWVKLNSFSHAKLWDGIARTESHTA